VWQCRIWGITLIFHIVLRLTWACRCATTVVPAIVQFKILELEPQVLIPCGLLNAPSQNHYSFDLFILAPSPRPSLSSLSNIPLYLSLQSKFPTRSRIPCAKARLIHNLAAPSQAVLEPLVECPKPTYEHMLVPRWIMLRRRANWIGISSNLAVQVMSWLKMLLSWYRKKDVSGWVCLYCVYLTFMM
jgi:hypothetical protein